MDKLEAIRMKIENDKQQDEQRQRDLESIQGQIDALNAQIDQAIDDGQNSTAEKLIANLNELKVKLSVIERINQRKASPDQYLEDLVKINAEEVSQIQPKIDKATTELYKTRKKYLEQKAALIKIVRDAVGFRVDCGALAGIGPLYANERYNRFDCVNYDRILYDNTPMEKETLNEIDPTAIEMLAEITNLS